MVKRSQSVMRRRGVYRNFLSSGCGIAAAAVVALGLQVSMPPAASASETADTATDAGAKASENETTSVDDAGADELKSRADRYSTFLDISRQNAAQLKRITDRLQGKSVGGLLGEDGYMDRHIAALEGSLETLTHAGNLPEERLAAHEKSALAFLDRSTQLVRLVGDLEQAEIAGDDDRGKSIRKEIESVINEDLFAALETIAPARLTLAISNPDEGAVFWPQAFHQMNLAIGNGGDQPAQDVQLVIEPDKSIIASVASVSGVCRETIDGVWNCDRDSLAPAEQWLLSVSFRSANPDGIRPGAPKGVKVLASVTSREPKISLGPEKVRFPVAACSRNYHSALGDIRDREAASLLTTLNASKSGDRRLNRRWRSARVSWPRGEIADLAKRTGSIVSARGIDPWLARQANGQFVARVVYGLRQYVRQDHYRALCTGTETVLGFYREMLEDFEERRRSSAADRVAVAGAARDAVTRYEELRSAGAGEDAGSEDAGSPGPKDLDAVSLVKRLAAAAGVELGVFAPREEPRETDEAPKADGRVELPDHAVLTAVDQLRKADIADGSRRSANLASEDPAQAARQAIALVEMLHYQDLALGRYQVMARAFDDIFTSIASADAAHCVCRSSSYQLAPTEAAVPVPGIEPPKRVRRIVRLVPPPRPKPETVITEPEAEAEPEPRVAAGEAEPIAVREPSPPAVSRRSAKSYERVLDVRSGRYILIPVY